MKVLNAYDISMVAGGLTLSDSFSEREKDIFGYGMKVAIGSSWGVGILFGGFIGSVIGLTTPVGVLYAVGVGSACTITALQGLIFLGYSYTEDKLKQV